MKNSKFMTFAMAAALLASLTACGGSANAADVDYIYGQIDSVSGNDITLLLADYNENAESEDADSENESDTEKESGDSDRKKPDKGEMPEGFDPEKFKGEKPEGFSRPKRGDTDDEDDEEQSDSDKSERKKPEDFDPSNMPEGFSKPENGEMPEDFDPSDMPEGFDKSKFSKRKSGSSRYTLTGEQEELRVPVGTTVTTELGVETDFEVLKSGDIIKCSIEKDSDGNDVITAIWILEQ